MTKLNKGLVIPALQNATRKSLAWPLEVCALHCAAQNSAACNCHSQQEQSSACVPCFNPSCPPP